MRFPLQLTKVFLKTFLRDRQSMFFSLVFPLSLMVVFGFINRGGGDALDLGVVDQAANELSQEFITALVGNPLLEVVLGDEAALRESLIEGQVSAILILPENFEPDPELDGADIRVIVDASQVRQQAIIVSVLQQALLTIEREYRGTQALFKLAVEDVQARVQSYLDFLLPGIIAFTLMQISIAGSGFNIVEYRRKGILKRLFVTPITPAEFITAIVSARLFLCLAQLSVLLAIAILALDVTVVGSLVSLYSVIILGSVLFLCIGFSLGSLAKTQQAVQAIGNIVIFPQMFLSGIFFPIQAMPEFIQPIATLLPLSFVASALREIATNGMALTGILPDLLGIAVWLAIGFVLATRYFVWKEVAG
jgi:ABC-2 type transport system permease protein